MQDHTVFSQDLVARARRDLEKRAALAATGALFHGYHPEMEAMHIENARALENIITKTGGWPDAAMLGQEAADAAWLITQHAISLPDFQRRALTLLEQHTAKTSCPQTALHAALLADRIRVFEGRPQIFGTQFDWDDTGQLSPLPIENPQTVDHRRAAIGLIPLHQKTTDMRAQAKTEGHHPPADLAAYHAEKESWAHKVGWRKNNAPASS